MNPATLALLGSALDIALKVVVILGPVLVGFLFHRKSAMSDLIRAIPDVYDAIQAKRASDGLAPLPSAIGEMLKLAAQLAGRALTAAEEARVRTALEAHDARLTDQGHTTTPLVVPTAATITSRK